MKTKHTPGPWTTTETDSHIYILSSANRGSYICELKKIGDGSKQKINAASISALPELIEALENFINFKDRDLTAAQMIEIANSAIAKARGES